MVAQSSRDDHMILEGCYIPDVMGSHTDWSSDSGLGCNGMMPSGSSQVRSGPICGTDQVRELLKGVGEVTVMGSEYGQLNGT